MLRESEKVLPILITKLEDGEEDLKSFVEANEQSFDGQDPDILEKAKQQLLTTQQFLANINEFN